MNPETFEWRLWGVAAVSLILLVFFGAILLGFSPAPDVELKATLNTLTVAIVSWWVGSSSGSASKDKKLDVTTTSTPTTTTTTALNV